MSAPIEHDRGLGTAYERYCFYQLLNGWADRFGAKSFLEGPMDGMAGVPSVYGVGLAARGLSVTSAVRSAAQAEVVRNIYHRASPGAPVHVPVVEDYHDLSSLAPADIVLSYHAVSEVDDWQRYLKDLASLARKALIVAVCNPYNWGSSLIRAVGKLRGISGLEAPDPWKKEVLGPYLWKLGRVKDHVYFDCPWWPDLLVSPGQTLKDRLTSVVLGEKASVTLAESKREVKVASTFVYGPERWPYFGGPGWNEELLPALLTHPSFEGGSHRIRSLTGHIHAFVVDVSPRTPRERRKLATAQARNA